MSRVESLREDCPVQCDIGSVQFWFEHICAGRDVGIEMTSVDGLPVLVRRDNVSYVCGWPDDQLMQAILIKLANRAKIATCDLPDGIRLRQMKEYTFVFNYGESQVDLGEIEFSQTTSNSPQFGICVLGDAIIPPSGVSIFKPL